MVKLSGFMSVNADERQSLDEFTPTLEAEESAVIELYERGIHLAAENRYLEAEVCFLLMRLRPSGIVGVRFTCLPCIVESLPFCARKFDGSRWSHIATATVGKIIDQEPGYCGVETGRKRARGNSTV